MTITQTTKTYSLTYGPAEWANLDSLDAAWNAAVATAMAGDEIPFPEDDPYTEDDGDIWDADANALWAEDDFFRY